MLSRIILSVSAIICLVRALGLLFVPRQLYASFGVTLDPAAVWGAQFLGGVILGVGMINWLSRTSPISSEALRAVLVGNFVLETVSMVVSVRGTVSGLFNDLGWITVGEHAIFVAAFGYTVFGGEKTSNE